jgi:hypothetical protein
MKIRIAFGAVLGLAAAFAFVWLQFRAEAIAQDVSPEVLPADASNPFGSSQVFSDSDAELSALSEPAGTTSVFAEDVNAVNEAPATSDPFADDTPPTRTSKHSASGLELVEPEGASYDPFSSDEIKAPDSAVDAFGFDSGSDSHDFGSPLKEQPLRIIRLRSVRAAEIRSLIESLFHENADKQRWFLGTENQSNSLIFKGPASEFDQFKKLASELDRLAETPIDPRKKTLSWPVPHAFDASPETPSNVRAAQWPIRIIRLRHLHAEDFIGIAWDLAESQNSETQLRIWFESATNSVVVRGPAAEISQVEQLAQQIDQPAIGAGGDEFMDSPFDLPADSGNPDVFVTNETSGWQEINGPDVQTQRMREYVAYHDQESVRLASEIRSLRRQHSSNHPKLAEARQKLEDVLEASFKLRLQLQELEVAAIKSKLADIESRVQRRSQLRQQIINRRLHELLGEKDDLSWEVARTGPALPSRSTGDHLPPPDSFADESTAYFGNLIPGSDSVEEELVPPTPYAGEIPRLESDAGTRVPTQPVAEFSIGVESDSETASRNIPQPDIDDVFGIVGREVPAETPVASRPQNGLIDSSRNEGPKWQQDLIVAENSVETASVKVEQVESRLSRLKGSDQDEDLEYELRLAMLALDQAKKLLEQKRRWIEAQRNSLKVNIRYLEKNLEAAKAEHEHRRDVIEKVTGVVPRIDRRSKLEIEKAELRLKQAAADMAVFEVENRTSRNSETPLRSYRDAPAIEPERPVIAKPQPTSRNRTVNDSTNGDFLGEPDIALPETSVPTESPKPLSPPEAPTVVPEPDSNPVRSS